MQNNSYDFSDNEKVKISAFIADSDHNGLKSKPVAKSRLNMYSV